MKTKNKRSSTVSICKKKRGLCLISYPSYNKNYYWFVSLVFQNHIIKQNQNF